MSAVSAPVRGVILRKLEADSGGGVHGDVTQLLARWSQGDRTALDSLTAVVYAELRKIAEAYLKRERTGHTLQPTALVHEAWIRLVRRDETSFENRSKFYAMAAQIMRQILVDHARGVRAAKRGGGIVKADLTAATDYDANRTEEFLVLDDALIKLAAVSPRQAQVIELRYFGGLNGDEIADLLGVSAATISREQRSAEAWLSHIMSAGS